MTGRIQTSQKTKRNKRYQENDLAIIEAILKHRRHISVNQLTRQLRISRSVFYNHYKSIEQAMTAFENDLMREFAASMNLIPNSASLKDNEKLFRELFLFMARYGKDAFYHICANVDNHGTLFRMMAIVYPKLYINWGNVVPSKSEDSVHIFFSIAVVFISKWGSADHCEGRKMWRYLRNLQKLSQNAYHICIEPFPHFP